MNFNEILYKNHMYFNYFPLCNRPKIANNKTNPEGNNFLV